MKSKCFEYPPEIADSEKLNLNRRNLNNMGFALSKPFGVHHT